MTKTKKGSGKQCSILGCKHGDLKLKKWKRSICEVHSPMKHDECECTQPYQMHRFPNGKTPKSADILKEWVKNINRKDFVPNENYRVSSNKFLN